MGTYHLLADSGSRDLVYHSGGLRPTYVLQAGGAFCALHFFDDGDSGGSGRLRVWAVTRGALHARPFFLVSHLDAPQPQLLGSTWSAYDKSRGAYASVPAVRAVCAGTPTLTPVAVTAQPTAATAGAKHTRLNGSGFGW